MTGLIRGRLMAGMFAAGTAVLMFGAVNLSANAAAKSPKAAKNLDIPLPELAPWHNRQAVFGGAAKSNKAAAKPADSGKTNKKTKSAKPSAKDIDAAKEPSVTTLIAPDPNTWTDDDIAESLKACIGKLAAVQAKVEISEPFRKGACGAPAAVEVKKLGTKYPITMSPPAVLRCDMVVSLYKFVEESLQPAAIAVLGSPIESFNSVGSYQCRNRNGDPGGKLSEHALANALDVGTFKLANGKTVKVVSDWGPTARDAEKEKPSDPVVQPVAKPRKTDQGRVRLASLEGKGLTRRELRRLSEQSKRAKGTVVPPPPVKKRDALNQKSAALKKTPSKVEATVPAKKPEVKTAPKKVAKTAPPPPKVTSEMRFLKRVHSEACQYFGTVLGPEANEAHRDHFHFDMAPRKRSNYCR